MPRLPACALAVALVIVPAAGCGNGRSGSATLFDSPAGAGTKTLRYPHAGLTVVLPKAFVVSRARAPQLFRASLEDAFVSSFAYRRDEQLPATPEELDAARDRLVKAAERRARSFRLRGSSLTRVARAPAVELTGDQTISMGRLRIHSLHVYKGSAEYVVELAAPVRDFRRLDRSTFPVIRRSLKVTGKVRKPPSKAGRRKARRR